MPEDRHDPRHAEESNDHLALIYEDRDEQFAAVVPFIRRGLERGERCLYVADDSTEAEVLRALRAGGVDVGTATGSGDLVVLTPEETYLRTGSFDRDAMVDFWEESLVDARDERGYTGVRAAAEMTWALDGGVDPDRLMAYESTLNTLYSGDDYVVLCQYNRERFPSDVLSDVIYTHPLVVSDGTVYRNDRYCPPDEFPNAGRSPLDVDRPMERLLRRGPTDRRSPHASDGGRAESHILPLISDRGNREVLVDWLADRYGVVTADGMPETLREEDIDLCILDPAGFERYRDALIDYKESQTPRILPYLLIRREDTPLLDSDARQYVDDVIMAPISQRELSRRVGSLLQLRDLSGELERKNEQLEFLVNAAAHDLRNPLQIARGYVEQLDDSDACDRIRTALNRMEHLVENLLTVNRTGREIADETLEDVDLTSLVTECWEVVPTENAALEIAVSEGVRIRTVPELVRQLIENLVRNAIEHGNDTVTIRVDLLSGDDGFYVADDGPGIPEEKRGAVFEEGYSTTAGSGLGLAIVKRVADTHDWEVRVTGSENGGARFEITGVEIARQHGG